MSTPSTLTGRVFNSSFLYNRFKPCRESCWTKKEIVFTVKTKSCQSVSDLLQLSFLFVPSFTVRYAGLSSHLPALLGDCVSLLCIQLVSICSSGQNKNINQFIWEKEKMKKIYKTPQKSNINTKCDNSVLPWFITWKARSFEPPKNKPKTFGPEEPASVIDFSVERIPQAPCDGSAEPLGNWLSNKGGKSAF